MTKSAVMNNSESPFKRLYNLVVVGPSIFSRIFWFALGGPLSIGTNYTIFAVANHGMGLSRAVSLGISQTIVTVLFFLWNYFLNFRTSKNWGECLPRYVAALAVCFAATYTLNLTGMKQLACGSRLLEFAVMVGSTVLVSGVKFLLYHFWVYPHSEDSKAPVEAAQH
jgi:putative flippase GtrA